MGLDATTIGISAALLAVAAVGVVRERSRRQVAHTAWQRARSLGIDAPVSLHPSIDPDRCVGCGSCVTACPEGDILALVHGRARLIDATQCVGHGACQTACPSDAIELVFGTATRGVQIPEVGADYQTNVPGLYLAGEIGGMGLIRNAVQQGVHAISHLAASLERRRDDRTIDVAILGAGPAGLAAALACRERGLEHVVFDQDGLGGSINHYPRRKLVMTAPAELPIVGRMPFREVSKEELLAFWQRVVRENGLQLRAPERVVSVQPDSGGFDIGTDRGGVRARRVVLAVGRRGTPRKLDVPGEDGSKVAYRLIEPERWKQSAVLVVGGGNSAVEAAVALADAGSRVTLSYRGTSFNRVAAQNQERLAARRDRHLAVVLGSQVQRIEPDHVVLDTPTGVKDLANEQIFVLIGGQPPTEFLEKIGVRMRWHHGEHRAATTAGRRT